MQNNFIIKFPDLLDLIVINLMQTKENIILWQ